MEDLDCAVVPGAHGEEERVEEGQVDQQLVEAGPHLRLSASLSDNNHARNRPTSLHNIHLKGGGGGSFIKWGIMLCNKLSVRFSSSKVTDNSRKLE